MDLQITTNAINQIKRILNPREATARCIETAPTKPRFAPAPAAAPLPRATPEDAGVPSRRLAAYLRALQKLPELDMHGLTLLRDGKVILEADFGAYDREVWHVSYSECKSVVALAVGLAIDEGLLSPDDRVLRFFEGKRPALAGLTLQKLTVRHLLTMTSGVLFNEAGSVTETDWVRGFLESLPTVAPGESFAYNSMNTYMLSAILREVTGQSLTDYLQPRLFGPMGIGPLHWETCPMGVEKGGWGLYLRREDFAKLGQLILQRGQWEGAQLVPAAWIDEATRAQAYPPAHYGDYDYGYQIWTGRRQNSFLFSGMFGQNVLGFWDTGLLLVTNAGNDEMFQQSQFFPLTHEYLGADFAASLPPDPEGARLLAETLGALRFAAPPAPRRALFSRRARQPALPPDCARLAGTRWRAVSPNAAATGLAPLMLQALQNVYTKGLRELAFDAADGVFTLTVLEADAAHVLPVGFDAPARASLSFGGETHLAATTGRFARDEDGRLCLLLRLSLLETAHARRLRLYLEPDGRRMEARFSETPGVGFLQAGLADALTDLKRNPIVAQLTDKVDPDYVDYKLRAVFEPVLRLERAD